MSHKATKATKEKAYVNFVLLCETATKRYIP